MPLWRPRVRRSSSPSRASKPSKKQQKQQQAEPRTPWGRRFKAVANRFGGSGGGGYNSGHRQSLSDLWGEYGWDSSWNRGAGQYTSKNYGVSTKQLERLVIAHKMAQNFVDSFATEKERYKVRFAHDGDPNAPAATNIQTHEVIISPRPALDPALSATQAGEILTGLSIHEVCHPRYGLGLKTAVNNAYPANTDKAKSKAADRLSNILDDRRIETRFATDYPGYHDIFEPARKYVGETESKNGLHKPSLDKPLDLAALAVRYEEYADWSDPAMATERDWWKAWIEKYAYAEDVPTHLKGVQEGIDHIKNLPPPPPEPESGSGDGKGKPKEKGEQDGSIVSCFAEELEKNPQDGTSMTPDQTQGLLDDMKDVEFDQKHGEMGRVRMAINEKVPYHPTRPNASATAYIRAALLKSRTGREETDRRMKTGRLDNQTIHELAFNSSRLFSRHIAPSPGKYLMWILMDHSGSMQGSGESQTNAMVAALGAATRDIDNLRMDMFVWSSGDVTYYNQVKHGIGSSISWYLARVWTKGLSLGTISNSQNFPMSGTPDMQVLNWTVKNIYKYAKQGERPVIIMASDGGGMPGMEKVVDDAKKKGIRVISLALGSYVGEDHQRDIYGDGNYIPWRGSVVATSRQLAALLAKIVNQ